jgi:hypothetical protein
MHVAKNRLVPVKHEDPADDIIELSKHPDRIPVRYDVISMTINSKLKAIEQAFGVIRNVVICMDNGNNWRASMVPPIIPGTEQASMIDYKGDRQANSEAERIAKWSLNQDYEKILRFIANNNDYAVLQDTRPENERFEADDWLVFMSEKLAKAGELVVVVSNDADVLQSLLTYENAGCVVVIQPKVTGDNVLYTDHFAYEHMKPKSIFDMGNASTSVTNALQNATIIAKQYMLLDKILLGDASDSISPLMLRNTGSKNMRLTRKQIDAIILGITEGQRPLLYSDLYDKTEQIVSLAHELMFKSKFDELPEDWRKFYIDKYEFNRKLVCINEVENPTNDIMSWLDQIYNDSVNVAYAPVISYTPYAILQQFGKTIQ